MHPVMRDARVISSKAVLCSCKDGGIIRKAAAGAITSRAVANMMLMMQSHSTML